MITKSAAPADVDKLVSAEVRKSGREHLLVTYLKAATNSLTLKY
jgi:hypothetical protein